MQLKKNLIWGRAYPGQEALLKRKKNVFYDHCVDNEWKPLILNNNQ